MNIIKSKITFILFVIFSFTFITGITAQTKIDSLKLIAKKTKHDTSIIDIYLKIGKLYINSKPDTALYYFKKSLKIVNKSIDTSKTPSLSLPRTTITFFKLKAESLYNIGTLYFFQNNYDGTIKNWEESLKIYERFEDKSKIANIQGNLGLVYSNKSEIGKSLKYYQKALKIYEDIEDKIGISKNLVNMGTAYSNQSKYNEALKCFHKAIKIKKEIGDKNGVAMNLGNIGIVYSDQSEFEKALEFYFKALKIYEENDDKEGIARNTGNIATVYSDQKNDKSALEYYFKALKIYEEIDFKVGIAANLGNIGVVYSEQGNNEKALEFYLKALMIFEDIGHKRGISYNLVNIGDEYSLLNKNKKALEYYHRALKINNEVGDKHGAAEDLISIGKLYNKLKKYNNAIKYSNRSLLISKNIETIELEENSYFILSNAYKGLKNYKKSLEYKELWIKLHDSIYNNEKAKAIENISVAYETEKKEKQIIQQQAELKTSKLETEKEKAEKEKQQSQRNMFIVAFGLMIILAVIVFYSYKQKKKANILLTTQKMEIAEANEELNQQNEEILIQKEEIENIHTQISTSIDYATRLQQVILPETKILDKYLSEHFLFYKPKDKVSGDFYWWANINNHTVISAADCTGHGVPGALMSMLGSSFLREIVEKERITNTGLILNKLRNSIIRALKQKGESGEQKDGMDIAIISLNHETNIVQFSGAYNPLYIVTNSELQVLNIKNDKNIKLISNSDINFQTSDYKFYEVKPDKMPIAIYRRMDDFKVNEIQLKKGDILYMFSDGYPDQFGGENNSKFKYKPFRKLLSENAKKPLFAQKEILNKAFEDWKGETEQIDDILVLGIKI